MNKIPSLRDYLERDSDPLLPKVNLGLVKEDPVVLETKVISAYQTLQEQRTGISTKGIFTPYIEAEDINGDFIAKYESLLEKIQKAPYKVIDDGMLRKLVYANHDVLGDYYSGPPLVFLESLGLVALSIIVGVVGTPLGLPAVALLGGTLLFGNPSLKGPQNKFTRNAIDYVRDVYHLNIQAQKMEHEVADIRTLDAHEMENLVMKYGKERLKKEGTDTSSLEHEEVTALAMDYGKMDLKERMDAAQKHVQQVKELTRQILQMVGITAYELKNYVASDIAQGEALARINNETDLDARIEALRRSGVEQGVEDGEGTNENGEELLNKMKVNAGKRGQEVAQ